MNFTEKGINNYFIFNQKYSLGVTYSASSSFSCSFSVLKTKTKQILMPFLIVHVCIGSIGKRLYSGSSDIATRCTHIKIIIRYQERVARGNLAIQ